jgi:hypothetical protein
MMAITIFGVKPIFEEIDPLKVTKEEPARIAPLQ